MLSLKQRLVSFYILYGMYSNEKVKTTPFYQLMLEQLEKSQRLHPVEKKLLADILWSVPRISKRTPNDYSKESETTESDKFQQDFAPYYKAHAANMPKTSALSASSLIHVIKDEEEAAGEIVHEEQK